MAEATVDEVDPTLAALVPRRSTVRNIVMSLVGLVVLVLVGLSSSVLRPTVAAYTSGARSIEASGRAETTISVTGLGRPWLTLESVGDLPGATVVGAWYYPQGATVQELPVDDHESGLEHPRSVLPDLDTAALPQRLDHLETGTLVILWDVDCDELDPDRGVELELGSALGTSHRQEFDVNSAASLPLLQMCQS